MSSSCCFSPGSRHLGPRQAACPPPGSPVRGGAGAGVCGLRSAEPLRPLASGKCLQPDARSSELLERPLPQPGSPARVFSAIRSTQSCAQGGPVLTRNMVRSCGELPLCSGPRATRGPWACLLIGQQHALCRTGWDERVRMCHGPPAGPSRFPQTVSLRGPWTLPAGTHGLVSIGSQPGSPDTAPGTVRLSVDSTNEAPRLARDFWARVRL